MDEPVYKASIETLIQRLSELMRQRRKLDADIARLQTLIRTQAILSGSEAATIDCHSTALDEPIGFTEAIRQILFTYRVWLSPTSVRDLLPSVGFYAKSSRNALISVHTVLKRLVRSGIATRRQSGTEVLYRKIEADEYLGTETTASPGGDQYRGIKAS